VTSHQHGDFYIESQMVLFEEKKKEYATVLLEMRGSRNKDEFCIYLCDDDGCVLICMGLWVIQMWQ